ncbi:MAG: alpha/beta hydrolase [Gemmatimonadales bacterium]
MSLALALPCRPVSAQEPRDTLVSVGDYRLHFRVIDGARPTVLLEAAGGANASAWDQLAPRLAAATGRAVVWYDRSGFGSSDLPSAPYDIRDEVAGLWRGLRHLGMADSLVLVGHSYGGFLIRLTADRHPDAVVGLVYVDPNDAEFVESLGGAAAVLRILGQGARDGGQRPQPATKAQRANAAVIDAFPATVRTLANLAPFTSGTPVRVITAGKAWWPTEEASRAFREAHEADRSHRARRAADRVGAGGHLRDQRSCLIEVVSEVVQVVRRPLSTGAVRRRWFSAADQSARPGGPAGPLTHDQRPAQRRRGCRGRGAARVVRCSDPDRPCSESGAQVSDSLLAGPHLSRSSRSPHAPLRAAQPAPIAQVHLTRSPPWASASGPTRRCSTPSTA